MPNQYHKIAFTPAVKALQEAEGSREMYAKYEASPKVMKTALGDAEQAYIAERDSFYLASVGETGWPYMQHRGGPAGFVKMLSDQEFGWAEYVGNRQYISTGNIAGDDRVSLFFIDYSSKTRLKVFGHARVIAPDNSLMAQLSQGSPAQIERGIAVKIESFEWNCPKYITERHRRADVDAALSQMGARIAELEAALAAKG